MPDHAHTMPAPVVRRRIAVVEDAESLLLPRNEGSQSSVRGLLNATDGLLRDHLRLQIIATTNAPVRELDAALTRPGRLVGVREFGRLPSAQAQRLAQAKGLKLPDQPGSCLHGHSGYSRTTDPAESK